MSQPGKDTGQFGSIRYTRVPSFAEISVEGAPWTSLGTDYHGVLANFNGQINLHYRQHLMHAHSELDGGAFIITNGSQKPDIDVETIHASGIKLKQFPGVFGRMLNELDKDPAQTAFATDSKSELVAAHLAGMTHLFLVEDQSLRPHPVERLWRATGESTATATLRYMLDTKLMSRSLQLINQ
mgnify:CR=1 FL=1